MPFEVMDCNLTVLYRCVTKSITLFLISVTKDNNNRIWFLSNPKAACTVFGLCTLELKIRCSGTKKDVKGDESSAGNHSSVPG